MTRGLTNSYNNIRGQKKEEMTHKKEWLMTSEEWEKQTRLDYILSIQSHIPSRCPHCHNELTVDEEQIYCPHCGLVTQDSYPYQAGQHFKLPHGLKLM